MPITLNHTIVPSKDKVASAEFFARIFDLSYEGSTGHFAPVQVNDTLTLDFDNSDQFESHHYAFHVSDAEFDAIFGRIKDENILLWQWTLCLGGHADQQPPRRKGSLLQRPGRPST